MNNFFKETAERQLEEMRHGCHRRSLDYFIETGTINGAFLEALQHLVLVCDGKITDESYGLHLQNVKHSYREGISCNCVNIETQSAICYSQMIIIVIPDHMKEYRERRLREGFSNTVAIDPCIVDEIKLLWSKGIITHGSCCGHGKQESFVNVDETSIDSMIEMGYVQNHPDKTRKDTFRLKSAG